MSATKFRYAFYSFSLYFFSFFFSFNTFLIHNCFYCHCNQGKNKLSDDAIIIAFVSISVRISNYSQIFIALNSEWMRNNTTSAMTFLLRCVNEIMVEMTVIYPNSNKFTKVYMPNIGRIEFYRIINSESNNFMQQKTDEEFFHAFIHFTYILVDNWN